MKIGFFKNEALCSLSPLHRLLFSGLWLLADREGRLEDRPRRIRAELFPYDPDVDADQILTDLEATQDDDSGSGFIRRYETNGLRVIQVTNWRRHQFPTRDEPPSELPAEDGSIQIYDRAPNETARQRIYARDDYRCQYCDVDLREHPRQRVIDHVIPYVKGGTHRDQNLVTACKKCNGIKGQRTPSEAGLAWPTGYGERYMGASSREAVGPPVDPPSTPSEPPVDEPLTLLDLGSQSTDLSTGEKSVSSAPRNGAKPKALATTADIVLTFPTVGKAGSYWHLTRAQVSDWSEAYPGVDVMAEAQKALAWVKANTGHRKTTAGMARFLVNWLNRATDRRGPGPAAGRRETVAEHNLRGLRNDLEDIRRRSGS